MLGHLFILDNVTPNSTYIYQHNPLNLKGVQGSI